MEENDLQKRLFRFAVDVIKMLRTLKGGNDLNIIKRDAGIKLLAKDFKGTLS